MPSLVEHTPDELMLSSGRCRITRGFHRINGKHSSVNSWPFTSGSATDSSQHRRGSRHGPKKGAEMNRRGFIAGAGAVASGGVAVALDLETAGQRTKPPPEPERPAGQPNDQGHAGARDQRLPG